MASPLGSNHPEQVQAVGMAAIGRENLAVKSFGIVQAPGLMVLQGGGEHSLNGRCGALQPGPSLTLVRPTLLAIHLSVA